MTIKKFPGKQSSTKLLLNLFKKKGRRVFFLYSDQFSSASAYLFSKINWKKTSGKTPENHLTNTRPTNKVVIFHRSELTQVKKRKVHFLPYLVAGIKKIHFPATIKSEKIENRKEGYLSTRLCARSKTKFEKRNSRKNRGICNPILS